MRALVAVLRSEVGGDRAQMMMVPQTHRPAEKIEVNFGEFTAVIVG